MKSPQPKDHIDKYTPYLYNIANKIHLDSFSNFPSIEFKDVLINRRSHRLFDKPINTSHLYQILHLSTKITSISQNEEGFIETMRVVPSGGARHPIDLLTIEKIDNLNCLNLYNPIDNSISRLQTEPTSLQYFIQEIEECLKIENSTIIWFAIQEHKTSSKYHNPQSLIWRDVGALLYCIQLVCTYLGAKSCPIGTLANKSFNRLFTSDKVSSGGGILIGL